MSLSPRPNTRVVLVGAGLNNCLLAWFLVRRNKSLKVMLIDEASEVNPARTWSFHASDVGNAFDAMKPLVSKSWNGYEVRFPKFQRKFETSYCTIKPRDLQHHLTQESQIEFLFSAKVTKVTKNRVHLENGEALEADCVIDGRGDAQRSRQRCGYQKFFGLTLRLKTPHHLTQPTLMDASVTQIDGYRFFYLLPWNDLDLLVEDTRYSSDAKIDPADFKNEILKYCAARGWVVDQILESEIGVLPIPLTGTESESRDVPKIGMAGGLFHPVTGYSLPDGVRVADSLSKLPLLTTDTARIAIKEYVAGRKSLAGFYFLLNRMMFLAAPESARFKIFERFYHLSETLIQRFYQGVSTYRDRIRILSGRPPVPVWRAVRSAFAKMESQWI